MDAKDDSFVPELSDSIDLEVPVDDSPPQKKKKLRVKYSLLKTFDCKQDAEQFLIDEKCWATNKHSSSEEGTKRYLRCNRVKARQHVSNAVLRHIYCLNQRAYKCCFFILKVATIVHKVKPKLALRCH